MTDLLPTDETEFTELVDADVPRVDLVGSAANGVPGFLVMKQDAQGLLDPDFVRELVAKAEPDPQPDETVTMTGSPAAIAKFIHQAAQRHAPTETTDNADGSLNGSVAKEMDMDDNALDPTVALAEPDTDAPGAPTDPGSPAWEAVDAATARKWTSILARAKHAVGMLADREMLEAAAGDGDDAMQVMDLDDACCAIDYAISILAPFAVAEQAEADCGAEMQAVGKALADWNPEPLDTIEALGQVRKAGRVLSTTNEAAIRGAVESLQKVLASLPSAPTAPEDGQSVAKEQETDMPEPTLSAEVATDAGETPAMGVAKANSDPQLVVYDQKGRLIGIVNPADLTPVANSEAEPEPDEPDEPDDDTAEADEPAGDATPEAAADAAPETTDLTPAPAAEVGTPADAVPDDQAVTKSDTNDTDTISDVLKSSITDVVKAALADYSATQEQAVAKQAEALAHVVDVVETLKGQVKALEEQPAVPKVFTNGAVPPANQLRGQDRGARPIDVTKAQELKKGLYSADAPEQNRIANDMQSAAIARLQEIHQRRA